MCIRDSSTAYCKTRSTVSGDGSQSKADVNSANSEACVVGETNLALGGSSASVTRQSIRRRSVRDILVESLSRSRQGVQRPPTQTNSITRNSIQPDPCRHDK